MRRPRLAMRRMKSSRAATRFAAGTREGSANIDRRPVSIRRLGSEPDSGHGAAPNVRSTRIRLSNGRSRRYSSKATAGVSRPSARTRSGWRSATSTATRPPIELPTMAARSTPAASSAATADEASHAAS